MRLYRTYVLKLLALTSFFSIAIFLLTCQREPEKFPKKRNIHRNHNAKQKRNFNRNYNKQISLIQYNTKSYTNYLVGPRQYNVAKNSGKNDGNDYGGGGWQAGTPSGYAVMGTGRREVVRVGVTDGNACSYGISRREDETEWVGISGGEEGGKDDGMNVEYGKLKNNYSASIYLYRAYLREEDHSTFTIYLIGISRERFRGGYCRVWGGGGMDQILVPATVSEIIYSHQYRYKELIFSCSFKAQHLDNPTHTTIVSSECSIPSTTLQLLRVAWREGANGQESGENDVGRGGGNAGGRDDREGVWEQLSHSIFTSRKALNNEATGHYGVRQIQDGGEYNGGSLRSEGEDDSRKVKDSRFAFTVCLSPLNEHYNDHAQLVEWMETNMILGVNRFTVYNHSSGSEVGRVLEYYAERGVVEVVQWRVPVGVGGAERPAEVAYYAQVSSLNDCLFRSKRTSRFIINVDLDEIIVPKMVDNYSDLLKGINENVEVFSFRNVFFHLRSKQNLKKFKKSQMKRIKGFKLRTIHCKTRSSFIWDDMDRSKMIVNTKTYSPLTVHYRLPIHESTYSVPPSQALLHHYRRGLWEDDREASTVEDASMQQYAEKLIQNVQRVYNDLDLS